ncbi:MAG TPA: hypothetical protein VGD15_11930 [Kribbella sp.]|jgi:hypothetical protein
MQLDEKEVRAILRECGRSDRVTRTGQLRSARVLVCSLALVVLLAALSVVL